MSDQRFADLAMSCGALAVLIALTITGTTCANQDHLYRMEKLKLECKEIKK